VKYFSCLERQEPEAFDERRPKRVKGKAVVRGRSRVPLGTSNIDKPEKRCGFEGNSNIFLVPFGRGEQADSRRCRRDSRERTSSRICYQRLDMNASVRQDFGRKSVSKAQ
jgi:hypothetical protein